VLLDENLLRIKQSTEPGFLFPDFCHGKSGIKIISIESGRLFVLENRFE